MLSRVISGNLEGAYIGALSGAATLCFGGCILAMSDSSSPQVKLKAAFKAGIAGLLVGSVSGTLVGWIAGKIIGISGQW